MSQIAAGKGKAPEPFILRRRKACDTGRGLELSAIGEEDPAELRSEAPVAAHCRSERPRDQTGEAGRSNNGASAMSSSELTISHPDKETVAGGRSPRRHEARPRPLSRSRRPVDDRAHQGAPVLRHPSARRHQRRDVLSAPRHARNVELTSTSSAFPATASPISKSTASRASSRSDKSRRSNSIPGIARRSSRTFRGGSSSISIRHRTSNFRKWSMQRQRTSRTAGESSASSPSAKRPAARGCTS